MFTTTILLQSYCNGVLFVKCEDWSLMFGDDYSSAKKGHRPQSLKKPKLSRGKRMRIAIFSELE